MKILKPMLVLIAAAALVACGRSSGEHEEHEEHGAAEAFERGPHDGRLLRDGEVTVELAIYERGVPPEFHAWVTAGGKPVDPKGASVQVRLSRSGRRREHARARTAR